MRWTWPLRSRMNCLRVRVRSRSACTSAGGTKLGRIRPCARPRTRRDHPKRRRAHARQVSLRRVQGAGDRRRVAFVGRVYLSGHHRPRIQINSMLGLVGQMGCSILHSGDPRLGIGLADPLLVRQRLTPALPVQANEVLGGRGRNPALLGHPLQHRAIALPVSGARSLAGPHWPPGSRFPRRCARPAPARVRQSRLEPSRRPLVHLMGRRLRVFDS